jgi:hypothetical protein
VDEESAEFLYWEMVGDDEWACEACVTGAERQAIDEDEMAFGDAMTAAGFGGDADPEAMSETEYAMREDLAVSLYEHDQDA